MKSSNFREQVALVTAWFKEWNECEQTVALYSLLKKSSPVQAKFMDQVLQQSLAECTDVKQLEAKANDEGKLVDGVCGIVSCLCVCGAGSIPMSVSRLDTWQHVSDTRSLCHLCLFSWRYPCQRCCVPPAISQLRAKGCLPKLLPCSVQANVVQILILTRCDEQVGSFLCSSCENCCV